MDMTGIDSGPVTQCGRSCLFWQNGPQSNLQPSRSNLELGNMTAHKTMTTPKQAGDSYANRSTSSVQSSSCGGPTTNRLSFPVNSKKLCQKKKSFLTSLAAIYHRKKLSCLVYPRYKFRTEIPEYCPKNLPFSHARSILGRPCQTPRNRSNQHSQKKSEISYCAHLIIT